MKNSDLVLQNSYGGNSSTFQAVMLFYRSEKEVIGKTIDLEFNAIETPNELKLIEPDIVQNSEIENENKVIKLNSKSKLCVKTIVWV